MSFKFIIYCLSHTLCLLAKVYIHTRWGQNRFTVVCMGITQELISNARINCVSHTHDCKPTFPHPGCKKYLLICSNSEGPKQQEDEDTDTGSRWVEMSHDSFPEEVATKGVEKRWMWLSQRPRAPKPHGLLDTACALAQTTRKVKCFWDSCQCLLSLLRSLATSPASPSQAILHSPGLLQPNLDSPPNGSSLGLIPCFPLPLQSISFLFSDGSFINNAWRLKSFF